MLTFTSFAFNDYLRRISALQTNTRISALQTNTRFDISQCAPAESRLGSTVPSARPTIGWWLGPLRRTQRGSMPSSCGMRSPSGRASRRSREARHSRPPSPAWRPRARRRGGSPGRWRAWRRARWPPALPL